MFSSPLGTVFLMIGGMAESHNWGTRSYPGVSDRQAYIEAMRRHLAATFKTHGLILSIRCLRLFHVGAMPYGSPSRPPQLECRLISSCRIAYGR
ncbi:hypothetical protein N7527_007419 [Penicillium freii]|nr:hypothetical protein N7527_007419 [Penicillium freii]